MSGATHLCQRIHISLTRLVAQFRHQATIIVRLWFDGSGYRGRRVEDSMGGYRCASTCRKVPSATLIDERRPIPSADHASTGAGREIEYTGTGVDAGTPNTGAAILNTFKTSAQVFSLIASTPVPVYSISRPASVDARSTDDMGRRSSISGCAWHLPAYRSASIAAHAIIDTPSTIP